MYAMATSPYSIELTLNIIDQTTNAYRASRLILGPCSDQLRDIFHHHTQSSHCLPPSINNPDPSDRSLSANIEKIRNARIFIARILCDSYPNPPKLSNTYYRLLWQTVRGAVLDLDTYLNNEYKYLHAVDFLGKEVMNPVTERHYAEELKHQFEVEAATGKINQGLYQIS
ncbi:uncharacterized protein LOC134279388 [Saccostrea cucullata]|uniref:uncharacterized protein LOC134259583 n=1 Tax=Saccostrea cuccullata TaxID=36930 RepID=UPI002ED0D359